MSLVFKSVKKISKKKRKSGNKNKSKKCCKDPFEDNPTKFVVEDEESRSDFPSLNSVYKTELFGTPLPFRNGNGYDCMKFLKIKTKLQSIVFMNEYMNKSFEELRWEDYQCNRKGSHIFEERNYLKCLSKDTESVKWKTVSPPKKDETAPIQSISPAKFPILTKPNPLEVMVKTKPDKAVVVQPYKIILQRPSINRENVVDSRNPICKSSKERSILTNVNKFCTIKEIACCKPLEVDENENSISRSDSDVNITSKTEEMVEDNLKRYFSSDSSEPSLPYEIFTESNNYYLPCSNINMAYKHRKPNLSSKARYISNLMKTNPFGHNSLFDKLDPEIKKESLYAKLLGLSQSAKLEKKIFQPAIEKYTVGNKFSMNYFWGRFSPYSKDKVSVAKGLGAGEGEECVTSKKYLLGLYVAS